MKFYRLTADLMFEDNFMKVIVKCRLINYYKQKETYYCFFKYKERLMFSVDFYPPYCINFTACQRHKHGGVVIYVDGERERYIASRFRSLNSKLVYDYLKLLTL